MSLLNSRGLLPFSLLRWQFRLWASSFLATLAVRCQRSLAHILSISSRPASWALTVSTILRLAFRRPLGSGPSGSAMLSRTGAMTFTPSACSAQFWLDIRDGRLLVTAVVTDDRHVQPFSGFDVWKGDNIQLAICHGSEPYCELGLTHRNDGASETFVFSAPKDAKPSVSLQTARDDARRTTTYRAAIDLASIGMTEDTARRGFLFNAIVNDNDGDTREGYMAIAPGIGAEKSVRLFPVIRLADK